MTADHPTPARAPLDGEGAPWGHSLAAHRVHGWCADCPGRDLAAEAVAWRVHENRRHEVARAACGTGETTARPGQVDLQLAHDRPCPTCGAEALSLVTVTYLPEDGGGRRPAGGWAHCSACDATPHPLLEVPDRA